MNDQINKPYIKLDNTMGGGIVSLFMFDKGFAKHLSSMAQELMRRPSTLSVGERELIAAYASKLNDCQFCYRSHAACAAEFLGNAVVDNVIRDNDVDAVSEKLRHLLYLAGNVTLLERNNIAHCVENAKNHGATDQEIHDTVAIAAFFNLCNRYVDGLATTYNSGEELEGGKGLFKYGYLMTFRRLFGDIIPKVMRQWIQERKASHGRA